MEGNNQKNTMKHALAWFEIPVSDIERARKFYEAIFEIKMIPMDMIEGLEMAMFPVEEGGVGGALCQNNEFYRPSHDGTLVYLNADPDLQQVLDRLESEGGTVITPKTQITEEYGFMAVIEDSEGNRIALHSQR